MASIRIYWLLCFIFLALGFSAESTAANFENTLAQRLQACTACHEEQGRAGPDGYYPRLAGKPAAYLYNQLLNFREGRRHYSLMSGLLDGLDDTYLREIAQHFASLDLTHAKPLMSTASKLVLARGQTLATQGDAALGIPACTQCHGVALTGAMPQFPGLLGLPRDYLNAQLGGWKTGQRKAHTPDCMALIAKKLSDADASAVTHWLASQAVAPGTKPAFAATASPSLNPAEACGNAPLQTVLRLPEPPAAAIVSRGQYLTRIGNCAACHTARGGMAFAGGKRLDTPFGAAYSSNITPHAEHGIGAWSADDFWRAMHHGKSRDGRLLNPAFPYTNYTHVSRDDSDALFSYLKSIPPADQANKAQALRWPFNTQWALATWRWLYFTPASLIADRTPVSRGTYLVQGLGHCSACHSQRNRLGAVIDPSTLGGAMVPGTAWFAPALVPGQDTPWSQRDLARYLTTGYATHGNAKGPMAEVISGGTQYLTDEDAMAIAHALQPGNNPAGVTPMKKPTWEPSPPIKATPGNKLYEKHCASCHGLDGRGVEGAYPRLAGSATVSAQPPHNLLQITLQGGFGPTTAKHSRPFGMPPFQLQLSNLELSLVLTHIRAAWGNAASPVSEFDINKLRPTAVP